MNLRTTTLQQLLLLAVIGLAIAYLGVLRPVTRRAAEADGPNTDLRERLAKATLEAGLPRSTSFGALGNRLTSLRAASDAFAASVREAVPRLEQPPEIRARLEEPFQLVEFLNESQRRLEELAALAQSTKGTLTPGLPRGFPRYLPEVARPELLWVQLATVNRLVRTALRSGVLDIREVSVEPLPLVEPVEYGPTLPTPPPSLPITTAETNRWSTLRVHLTAVGPVDSIGRMLLALSLTPEELKRTGLPEDLAARPALFLDHLLIRRNQLEAAEQAQVDLVVSTVVANEEP